MGRRIYIEFEKSLYTALEELAISKHRSPRDQIVKIIEDTIKNSKDVNQENSSTREKEKINAEE